MAKALFGHVVAPAQLRLVEENAVLRTRVRRLEQELEELRAQRDAAIAHELLSLTGVRRARARLNRAHPHHRAPIGPYEAARPPRKLPVPCTSPA